MDQLILEVQTTGLHQYYPVSPGITRVGRAYDNDIILSDPTIAPYHFELEFNEDSISISNLAEVNPLSINGRTSIELSTNDLALPFKLGRLQLVLRNRQESVALTRPIAGKSNRRNPFGHWLWALGLVLGCLAAGTIEFYLDGYQQFSAVKLMKHLLSETLLGLIAFVVGFSLLEKLLVNRWEIKQVIVAVCLVYLIGSIVEPGSQVADYYFSSGFPSTFTMLFWFLLVIPAAIAMYLVHISHLTIKRSAFIAVLISAPLAIPVIMQKETLSHYFRDFSAEAHYHRNLSSLNVHRQPSLTVNDFIDRAAELEPGKRSN